MRGAFDQSLGGITDLLAEMAVKAGAAMHNATHALLDADLAAADAVIQADDEIDDLTGRVEQACYAAAALQQPVARDLRIVMSALQISSSLERMGDLAEHVAGLVRMRHPRSIVPEELRPVLVRMGARAEGMATRTASLLATRDLSLATQIVTMDDEMDDLHHELFSAVLSPDWTHGVESAIDVTRLARYYERYADHLVVICRRVIQLVTGEPYALTNPELAPGEAGHGAP